jgi:nucleotide-binding universal stress UspA family protein
MLNKILVPIDDSILVKNMIKKLHTTIDLTGKSIFLTYISDYYAPTIYSESTLSEYYISEATHLKSSKEFAKKLFDKYSKLLDKASSVTLVHSFSDDIPDGILKAANKNKVDCIAMASHRYTGINNVLLGDKVHKVIVSSKLPVLVL